MLQVLTNGPDHSHLSPYEEVYLFMTILLKGRDKKDFPEAPIHPS